LLNTVIAMSDNKVFILNPSYNKYINQIVNIWLKYRIEVLVVC